MASERATYIGWYLDVPKMSPEEPVWPPNGAIYGEQLVRGQTCAALSSDTEVVLDIIHSSLDHSSKGWLRFPQVCFSRDPGACV